LAEAGALEDDFVGGFGVADPLGAASRGDQDFFAGDFHEIDRRAINLAGFAAADFEEVDEIGSEAEAGEEAEGAVEEGFESTGWLIGGGGGCGSHTSNPTCLTGMRAISFQSDWADKIDREKS